MKRIGIIIIGLLLLVNGSYAQSAYKEQVKKFVYMTSFGAANGFGQFGLMDGDHVGQIVKNNNINIQIHQLLGYQFCNNFYMGIGAGADFWNHTAFVPIYLNLSVNMLNRKISPLLFVNAGYGFKWYISSQPENGTRVIHGTDTGLMGEVGLGLRIKFNDKLSLNISGICKVQQSGIRYSVEIPGEKDFSQYATNSHQKALYHFAGARIGIMY